MAQVIENNRPVKYTAKDYKNASLVKWCPGCGDHGVLACLNKAMAECGKAPHQTAVISGIGCSSRLPYYMATYGMHTIHGRACAIATGVKVARPDLDVWVISGDGDCLAIGGNHFIHALRRNVDISIVLMNNKIYGLTKGQYSPTSPRGLVTKSSPYGTVEDPFVPAELVFGARGQFFARSLDVDIKLQTECLVAANKHKGTAVVEVLVNCVIFNNGIHRRYAEREFREERTLTLRHGEKMLFGKDKNKGLVLDGLKLKAVVIGEDGYTLDDILVHDAHEKDCTLHSMLALMGEDLPLALGVIRDVEAPTYEVAVEDQIRDVREKKGAKSLCAHLTGIAGWEVK